MTMSGSVGRPHAHKIHEPKLNMSLSCSWSKSCFDCTVIALMACTVNIYSLQANIGNNIHINNIPAAINHLPGISGILPMFRDLYWVL